MKTKRIISALLILIMILSASACASEPEKEVAELFFDNNTLKIQETLKSAFDLQSNLTFDNLSKFNKFGFSANLSELTVMGVNMFASPVTLSGNLLTGGGKLSGGLSVGSNGASLAGSFYGDEDCAGLKIDGITSKYIPLGDMIGSITGIGGSYDEYDEYYDDYDYYDYAYGITQSSIMEIISQIDFTQVEEALNEFISIIISSLDDQNVFVGTKDITVNGKKIDARTGKISLLGDDLKAFVVEIVDKIKTNNLIKELFTQTMGISENDFYSKLDEMADNVDVPDGEGIVVMKYFDKNELVGLTLELLAENEMSVLIKILSYDNYLSLDVKATQSDIEMVNVKFTINASKNGFESDISVSSGGVQMLKFGFDVSVNKSGGKQIINCDIELDAGDGGFNGVKFNGSAEFVINNFTADKIDVELNIDMDAKINVAGTIQNFTVKCGFGITAEKSSETPVKPSDYIEYTYDELEDSEIEFELIDKITELFPQLAMLLSGF